MPSYTGELLAKGCTNHVRLCLYLVIERG